MSKEVQPAADDKLAAVTKERDELAKKLAGMEQQAMAMRMGLSDLEVTTRTLCKLVR